MTSICHVASFNFFLGAVSEMQKSKVFPFFQHGCHTTWPMTSLPLKHSTWVVAPMVKISSQSGKRLRRKTRKFCADRQTNRQTRNTSCRARYLQNLWNKFDLKNNWWVNSMTWYATPLQISSQSDENWHLEIRPMLTFWPMLTSKIIGWLNSVTWNINPLQILSQSDENWGF